MQLILWTTVRFDIDRLESRLDKILSALPPLTPERSTVDGEHTPLFNFTKRIDALAQRLDDKTNAFSGDKTRQHLADVCDVATRRLIVEADGVQCDITFTYEMRAFMLREAAKRVMQVANDLRSGRATSSTSMAIVDTTYRSSPDRSSLSSESEHAASSRSSSSVPIGSQPLRRSSPRLVGMNGTLPNDSTPNYAPGVESAPMSTPRIRDIIRLGSYQNAALFTGSPVAVAVRSRFKGPPPPPTSHKGSITTGVLPTSTG